MGAIVLIAAAILGILRLVAPWTATAEETIRFTNGEWPPFTSQGLKHYGVYSHLVSEAFALAGIKVEYEFLPWSRSYQYVVRGQRDGSLTWAPTPEKEAQVLFSDGVVRHTKVCFHLKEFAFDWRRLEDLSGIRIGATASYTYGREFDTAASEGRLRVEFVSDDLQNLKKLFKRRIKLFVSDIDVGYDLVSTHFSPHEARSITHHPKPIQETLTCVIFTRKNPDKSRRLLAIFNKGLRTLRERGVYDEMFAAARRGAYRQ